MGYAKGVQAEREYGKEIKDDLFFAARHVPNGPDDFDVEPAVEYKPFHIIRNTQNIIISSILSSEDDKRIY